MIATTTQRWRQRRATYRPAGEPFAPRLHEVTPIVDAIARAFVVEHHYSGSYPAARRRFGLYRSDELVGAAVFSVPMSPRALACLPDPSSSVDLGRFVLLDEVPGNAESWFLSRCFELLRREQISGVIAFSDPLRRTAADGRVVMPGHAGTIYQATNSVFLGQRKRSTLYVLPDGTTFSPRAESKIRTLDRGHRYSAGVLERHSTHGGDASRRRAETATPRPGHGARATVTHGVEDQATAVLRIPHLLAVPAAVRFLSVEPMLGPVVLAREWLVPVIDPEWHSTACVDWVICGGESGHGARPMHPEWARSLRDQCNAARVPFLFKQWGDWSPIDQPWTQSSPAKLTSRERWVNLAGGHGFHGEEVWRMRSIGKHRAGRILDGRTWDEVPA